MPFSFCLESMTTVARILRFSAFALSLLLPGFSTVWAAESGVKIGIFDVRKIVEELSGAFTVSKGEIEATEIKFTTAESDELRKLNNETRRLRNELRREDLSGAERQKLTAERRLYGEKVKALREKGGEREAAQQRGTEEEIAAAAKRYGEEHGFTLLFEKNYWSEGDAKNALIFTGKVPDVTSEIVRRLKADAQRAKAKEETQKKAAPTKAPSAKP